MGTLLRVRAYFQEQTCKTCKRVTHVTRARLSGQVQNPESVN